jgi:hypothetical protein
MRLETFLDRLHARAVTNRWLVLFTAGTRALLGLAFLPSGFTKVRFSVAACDVAAFRATTIKPTVPA